MDYDKSYHPKMEEYAKTNLVPSKVFIDHFLERLQKYRNEHGDQCNDSAEYRSWAYAGDVEGGEDFVYALDIWEWQGYYETHETK